MNRPQFNHSLIPALILGLLPLAAAEAQDGQAVEQRQAFLESYCMDCHNFEDFSGGLAFDLLPMDAVAGHEETWEKVLTKAAVGMMPPPGEKQPQRARLESFLSDIEDDLARVARRRPNPGTPSLHRLNALEYQHAIRDLLHLSFDARGLLPADDSIEGFDNIAAGLVVSPALIQAYISAAGKVSRLAVGDPSIAAAITEYRPSGDSQAGRLEGMPLGTRGGIAAEHVFPLDAIYEVSVRRSGPSSFMRTPAGTKDEIEILLDGERLHVFPGGEAGSVKVPVNAGQHTLAATFVRGRQGYGVSNTYAEFAAVTRVTSLAINGPMEASGPGDTASRRRIFTCYPRERAQAADCAREIVETLATRAYRRPPDHAALDVLMAFFEAGRETDFETGIRHALARILVDPRFIYRFEEEPADVPAGEIFGLDDYDLASRLSFFLWSSIPDDELLRLAREGRLSQPEVLQAQVGRMLDDPRAAALVNNFAPQWLSLQLLDSATPVVPEFDAGLRESMRRETQLLVAAVFQQNRSVLELLNADYTFLNERLARHYGLPNVRGDHFRRVELPDARRAGLLGHASILTATSAPNRTSPVMRGTWILETLLGAPPPEPPPGVEADIDVSVPDVNGNTFTVRQRLEAHRENPSCAACHDIIDPIGFALENFDLIGRWRLESGGGPIDAAARLWDGTQLHGPAQLREALLDREERFVQALTQKLMTYALGRVLTYSDMPAVREIVTAAARDDYRFETLVQGIVASQAFQMRVKDAGTEQMAQH